MIISAVPLFPRKNNRCLAELSSIFKGVLMDINIALPEYQTCERQSTVYNVTIDAEETNKNSSAVPL